MKIRNLSILLVVAVLFASVLACGSSAPTGVSNVYMANDAEGTNKTTTFAPTDVIFVFFDVNGIEAGAQFQVRWFALTLDGQDPNEPFTVTDYTYNDEGTIYAQIESTDGGFPPAQYKVEVHMNGAKVAEQLFSVQ